MTMHLTFHPPSDAPRSWACVESPIGPLVLEAGGGALTALRLPVHDLPAVSASDVVQTHSPATAKILEEATDQLDQYFNGRRRTFDLALAPTGSVFQLTVWSALAEIPFGNTSSYGEVAARVGRPKGARAVGQANGANPLAIIVPCHRVLAANARLGGYSGGLAVKRRLLALESVPFSE